MHFDPKFYSDFVTWIQRKGREVLKTKPEQAPVFIGEVAAILKGVFDLLGTIAGVFKGGFMGVGFGVLSFLKNNPDPLKPVRDAIRAMQQKWGP